MAGISIDVIEDILEKSLDSKGHFFLFFSVKFCHCLGLYGIAGETQYWHIVCKNKIYLNSLQNGPEKLATCSFFNPCSKLVQINYIFSDNVVCIFNCHISVFYPEF
jgi:hypothetical protein